MFSPTMSGAAVPERCAPVLAAVERFGSDAEHRTAHFLAAFPFSNESIAPVELQLLRGAVVWELFRRAAGTIENISTSKYTGVHFTVTGITHDAWVRLVGQEFLSLKIDSRKTADGSRKLIASYSRTRVTLPTAVGIGSVKGNTDHSLGAIHAAVNGKPRIGF